MSNTIEHKPSADPVLRVQGLAMNLRTRQVSHHDQLVALTDTEYQLLYLLMLNAGQVTSLDLLHRAIYGVPVHDGGIKVRPYVSRLRRKLGDHHHALIRTAHGMGYRLAARLSSPN